MVAANDLLVRPIQGSIACLQSRLSQFSAPPLPAPWPSRFWRAFATACGGRATAVDVARHEIACNLIAPGPILVPRNRELFQSEPMLSGLARSVPSGGPGTPAAVAEAAGLVACRLDGSPLWFNKQDPWSPGLVISRPEIADQITEAMSHRTR